MTYQMILADCGWALTMEERIVLIQEFDAEFVEDASQVPELQDYYRNQSSGPTAEI